jgi:hypothetical protein
LYDGAQIATLVVVARKFIPSHDLVSRSNDVPLAGGVTAADELFFNLDGRILSTTDDEWRLEVCGVHTSGTEHWVQLHVHGTRECGLTLRTESLDAGDLLRRVDAWLGLAAKTGEPSLCTIGD